MTMMLSLPLSQMMQTVMESSIRFNGEAQD